MLLPVQTTGKEDIPVAPAKVSGTTGMTGGLCLVSEGLAVALGYLLFHTTVLSPRCYTVNHFCQISVTPKWHKAHQGDVCYNSVGYVEVMPTSSADQPRRTSRAGGEAGEGGREKATAGLCVHLIEEALQMPRFREIRLNPRLMKTW